MTSEKKTEFKGNNVKTVYKGTDTLTFQDREFGKFCQTALKKKTTLRDLN